MGTLYIIGNGLDLHYNLKTGTADFIDCLKMEKVYNEIDNAFDVLDYYGVDWSEFEQSLCYIDISKLASANIIQPDYLSDHEYDRDCGIVNMQMYVDSLSTAIYTALNRMVSNANENVIIRFANKPKYQKFRSGDAILNFNYTSTIEYLFHIPKDVPVLHIHGFFEKNEHLVFGYKSNNSETFEDIDEDSYDYYIDQQLKTISSFYERLEKHLQTDKLVCFLRKCSNIDKVVVLGQSMSLVDAPYMETVDKMLSPSLWCISYFEDAGKERVLQQNYSFFHKIKFTHFDNLIGEC